MSPSPPAAQVPDNDAPAIAPAVAPATQARTLRTTPVEQAPAPDRTRDGLVFLPFLGLHSFQDSNYSALSAGLRVGAFLGAFVNDDWSLNASATLDILDVSENVPAGTTVDNGGQVVSLAFSPLFHVGNPKAEFVVGPILGGWAEWVHATETESPETAAATGLVSSSAQGWEAGWTVGGNLGVFIPVSSGVRAGALLTLERRGVLHQCVEFKLTEQPAVGGTIGVDGTSGGGPRDSCQSSGPGATVLGFTFALLL
ncbi:MAG TPA: hypothetical protein VK989_08675 [Polyangia bacterium]|nr:hypothetical protein [Polyangia bacterium]